MMWSKKYEYYSEAMWSTTRLDRGECTRLQCQANNSCHMHHMDGYGVYIFHPDWDNAHTWYEFAKHWCALMGVSDLTGYCFEFDELSELLYPGYKVISYETCQIVSRGYNNVVSNRQRPRVEATRATQRQVVVKFVDGSEKIYHSVIECARDLGVPRTTLSSDWLSGRSKGYTKYGIVEVRYA